jgi:uncharacterized protein YxeA
MFQNLQNLGIIVISVMLLIVGGFFGYKIRDGQILKDQKESVVQENRSGSKNDNQNQQSRLSDTQESDQANSKNTTQKAINDQISSQIFWIKPNNPPVCPETHPIKGKVDGNSGLFYTKENKFYARVVPIVCFSSEEYAITVAGFQKKY